MILSTQIAEPEVDILELVSTDSFHVRLHNDDNNTFDWVIECLVDICNHEYEQAEQCAVFVHTIGSYVVKSGGLEEMETIQEILRLRYLSATVEKS